MAMQLNGVFIRGDHRSIVRPVLFESLGLRPVGDVQDGVPGMMVWAAANAMMANATGPHEVVRFATAEGWTVVADGTGDLTFEREVWRALSGVLRTRIVALRRDDEGTEVAIYEGGRAVRLVVWDDEGTTSVGAVLPVEALFHGEEPTIADLVQLAGWLGIDLAALNCRAVYTLVEVVHEESATDADRVWASSLPGPAPVGRLVRA